MVTKILALAVVLLLVYIVFFKNRKKEASETKETQNFVQCSKCDTFVEVKDAVLSSGKYICKDCIKG
ncbi:PP0621 family protein [Campylobacter sp.]|uniref:PP0621 family protein n=1 Tax=Campylobacter sp. TaxID=205 RepID=UPI002702F659|nr:PP0621 family protein [Campylobacter sp.]